VLSRSKNEIGSVVSSLKAGGWSRLFALTFIAQYPAMLSKKSSIQHVMVFLCPKILKVGICT
jgi:hypothetical protein